eukprot:NODE_255_length_12751_cov_0.188587.p8 type:complete len:112 gc:universal NODE_255_length_12751_cov_0.188587:559-224(-)
MIKKWLVKLFPSKGKLSCSLGTCTKVETCNFEFSRNRIILEDKDAEVRDLKNIVLYLDKFVDLPLIYFKSEEQILPEMLQLGLLNKCIWIVPLFVHSKASEGPKNSGWIPN